MVTALYILRPGDNEELRFSLRSLETAYPEMPVAVVGDRPEWLTGVEFRQGNVEATKPMNVYTNLRLGMSWADLPEDLLVMNDDFYITGDLPEVPVWWRDTLDGHYNKVQFRRDWWSKSINNSRTYLRRLGFEEPLSYEVHTPFMVQRTLMGSVLDRLPTDDGNPPQWRTVYGNIAGIGGKQAEKDVKVYLSTPLKTLPTPLLSSTDTSFRRLLPMLAEKFPHPSRFEAERDS